MPDFVNPSRLGQANLAGDADALFLKVFSGEIITTFEKYNVMMPLHRVRTIQSGKSATFPVTGVAGAKYHVPGESVLSEATGTSLFAASASAGSPTTSFDSGNSASSKYLSRFKHNEKVIFIDDVLVSSVFVADIDEMKNHYDVRSIYSTEIGRALAYTADKNLIRSVIAGARKSTDRFGGSTASDGYLGARVRVGLDATTTGSELLDAFFVAAQKMDEANVPSEDRFAILPPGEYYKMVNSQSDAINRDYAGEGSVAKGEIIRCAGIQIMKSNHVPTADESSTQDTLHGASGIKNDLSGADTGYSGLNYASTRGIIFHREALGTVKLMDLSLESEYIMERLGTLMLAKYAMGHNVLREECCYELYATA
ncbi:major capsid protein [uncultured Caudovirales phage]|uniref:Major capsid protein n=1 Tax=uncultured Caudovirales phage TaxID=2100421 RepID=A0A6J5M600_9CAUD|nr:major capsid protein [uncultured Caudovirales phage]